MKKLMMMFLALMLCLPAFAEESQRPALPVKIIGQEAAVVSMAEAMAEAQKLVHDFPVENSIRAELVELADGKLAWVVTTFDTSSLVYVWVSMVDAQTGDVLYAEVSDDGYLPGVLEAWTDAKGPQVLWTPSEKMLFDSLYALQPSYGESMDGDISWGDAATRAATTLGITKDKYDIGYGYLVGGEGYNGVWEICFVDNGKLVYKVNVDAVTGDVLMIEPDEGGNG